MEFLSYLISGISLGSVYAIIALGYTMVYGIAKMLNFAHGDVIMIGGYVSFCAMFYLGLPSIVAVLMAVVVCTVLGIVIERLAYKPLRSAPSLAVLITAIGVSYFLQNSALLIWKAAARSYPPVVTGAVKIFGGKLTVSYVSLLTIAACVVIMIGLTTFVNKSKMGKAMRACSEDKAAAQLMGINVNATISATFAIGSALAAIAGVLLCSFNTSHAHHRLHARHQGLYRGGVRRHRLHPRRIPRRAPARHHRGHGPGVYLDEPRKLDRLCRADRRAARQACRTSRQVRDGESVRWPE